MRRIFLDVLVLVLFLLVMSFRFIPPLFHEVLGLMMMIAVLVHLYLNRRWFTNFYKNGLTRQKFFSTLVNFSMLISFIAIIATGICMSNFIFLDVIPLETHRNMNLHQLHVSLPYILLILIGLHIGLHWREISGRLKIKINSTRGKIIGYSLLIILICAGVYGSFLNRVGDRIMMLHIFATKATELPFGIFILLLLSIMSVYAAVGFAINKFTKSK